MTKTKTDNHPVRGLSSVTSDAQNEEKPQEKVLDMTA